MTNGGLYGGDGSQYSSAGFTGGWNTRNSGGNDGYSGNYGRTGGNRFSSNSGRRNAYGSGGIGNSHSDGANSRLSGRNGGNSGRERSATERQKARELRSREERLARDNKVTKIRRHSLNRMNLGMVIFVAIFIYILILLYISSQKTTITGYEVKLGSLAVNRTGRGVIVRAEKVYSVKEYGYINYYARETERLSTGELVYSIDESGALSSMAGEGGAGEIELDESNLLELRDEIVNYRKTFSDSDFKSIYSFKNSLNGVVARLTNESMLAALQSISGNAAKNSIAMGYCDTSGIVILGTDGLESLIPQAVGKSTFNEDEHQEQRHADNTIVSVSDNAFKIITDENWSVVVPWNEEWEGEIENGKFINVLFLKNGMTSWAQTTILHNEDGDYLQLSFTNSMVTYSKDRYLDIELLTSKKEGLKIPNSSLVKREFYVIPRAFLTRGGDSDSEGFIRQAYLEDGSLSTEFVEAKLYDEVPEGVYVDINVFSPGDTILKPDSTERFTVSPKASLTGVYNMNNGYADFTKVNVLYSNKEYSIVESGTMYGLSVYDHIVLNGADVSDDDFVYE
ncbi:MAG: hypothetical protein K5989_00190 [Lachnospiraceae bacterium]|nr:hypothetical protein [Lachnospiraceae bacterium]